MCFCDGNLADYYGIKNRCDWLLECGSGCCLVRSRKLDISIIKFSNIEMEVNNG